MPAGGVVMPGVSSLAGSVIHPASGSPSILAMSRPTGSDAAAICERQSLTPSSNGTLQMQEIERGCFELVEISVKIRQCEPELKRDLCSVDRRVI